MERPAVAVVIPAWNEEATIGRVVREIKEAAPGVIPLVIDDGSTDATARRAIEAGATVCSQENGGYDAALNRGFAEADALRVEWVVTMDADGQHDPALLTQLLPLLDTKTDLVIGERDRFGRWSEWVFARWTRMRFGLNDPLCGFKACRLTLWREHGAFDTYGSVGTELALSAIKKGAAWKQLPFHVEPRMDASRFGSLRAHWKILRALLLSEIARCKEP